jgi:hypothetical protein
MKASTIFILSTIVQTAAAFAPAVTVPSNFESALEVSRPSSSSSSSALNLGKNDDDLLRSARSSRQAGIDDRVVELKRPLGLVLNEDGNGNVFVETVAPRGNAARS